MRLASQFHSDISPNTIFTHATYLVTTHPHKHDEPHPHADDPEESTIVRIQRLAMFLEAHFGEVELHMPEQPPSADADGETDDAPGLLIAVDDAEAFVNLATMVCLSRQAQLASTEVTCL